MKISAEDIDGIVEFAKTHSIDFAIVAPDDPLALGAVDRLESIGIKCFGPDQKAAIIESSKIFAKELMTKYNIPTSNTKFSPALTKLYHMQHSQIVP